MIDKTKLKECFEYLDESSYETSDDNLLVDQLMAKFNLTSEQAHFALGEWVSKQRESIERDYQRKLEDLARDHHERILELADRYPSLLLRPSR